MESVVKKTTKKVGITEVKKVFNRGQQGWSLFGYLCLTKALCVRVRAGVHTLDSLKGKNGVANRGGELGSPHLRVCGRAWAYVRACAGGVQRGCKW